MNGVGQAWSCRKLGTCYVQRRRWSQTTVDFAWDGQRDCPATLTVDQRGGQVPHQLWSDSECAAREQAYITLDDFCLTLSIACTIWFRQPFLGGETRALFPHEGLADYIICNPSIARGCARRMMCVSLFRVQKISQISPRKLASALHAARRKWAWIFATAFSASQATSTPYRRSIQPGDTFRRSPFCRASMILTRMWPCLCPSKLL